jgi:hypothetical protein
MPWAKMTHERMNSVYTKLLEDIHDGKHRTMDFTIKEMLVRAEFLKRDFTKRQLKILSMIFTLSFQYGKEWALIPKMKDFELAGISKIKIRSEIDQLLEMRVIEWNHDENTFSIKNPLEWTAPYHSGYNDERSRELFLLNLKHANINVEEILKSFEEGL